jgi:hypothetical protein
MFSIKSIAGMLVMLNISSTTPAQQSGPKPIFVSSFELQAQPESGAVLPTQPTNVSSIQDLLQNAQLYMGTTVALRGMANNIGKRSFMIIDDNADTLLVYVPRSSPDANTLVANGQWVTVTGQVRRMPEQANGSLGRLILVLENVRPNTTPLP